MDKTKKASVSVWNGIVIIVTALILSGTSIYISFQHNRTQWDISNVQRDAQVEASNNIKSGLNEVGDGLCKTSTKNYVFC